MNNNQMNEVRIGIIGAGYISSWHADAIRATPGAKLTAICDTSFGAAQSLASVYGVRPFGSIEELMASGVCDAVHVLTPPSSHRDMALTCMRGGLHVLVEKPVSTSCDEAMEMAALAQDRKLVLGASHNFLGLESYAKLQSLLRAGDLGRVSKLEVNWCFPLAPLRSGPFGIWLLRKPENLLLEIGPHLYAFVVDLLGEPEILHLELGQPVELSGGGVRHQSWRVLARVKQVDVTINVSLAEIMEDRTVRVWGSSAVAILDYGSDTLIVDKANTADIVVNPLMRQVSFARQHLSVGIRNAGRQLFSLNQKSPYGMSFRSTVGAFVSSIRGKQQLDRRFSFESAVCVMRAIETTVKKMGPSIPVTPPIGKKLVPTVMVIGGSGFIGRNLVRALVKEGHDVRVVSRGRNGPFDDIADHVETTAVSLDDKPALVEAMRGIDVVFNLAKSTDKSWEAALQNDVGTSVRIAEAAIEAKVRRFIYTGTIASFDMSDPSTVITDHVSFKEDMTDRNIYARSKAECEKQLMKLYKNAGLPLSIARPGIVIGHGGPLQHWGIGRWHGAGAVRIWGHGGNIIPLVLADDVSDGLIKIMNSGEAVGKTFNLVGEPLFSARGYFDAIHKSMGAKIQVSSSSLWALWFSDFAKYCLKRYVLRKKDASRASLVDWKSRAHFSRFDNAHTKQALNWHPESDRDAFIQKGIVQANLFGV